MKDPDQTVNTTRRQLLKGGALVAVVSASASPSVGVASPMPALLNYPVKKLGNVRTLLVDQPIRITYPDNSSPGILLKLGRRVEAGVGPEGDIVAFSALCPHKGFPLAYVAADKTLNCRGHYSRFDCEKGGQEIFGHATQNLPRFRLTINSAGDIFAEAVDELIYGRLSNIIST
jgi:arsenite oxidase small subunit